MGKLYTHITRTPGDVIQSTDWNKMGSAIQALDDGKMDVVGGALNGALSVVGSVNASQPSTFGSDLSVGANLTVTGKATAMTLSALGPITPSIGSYYFNGILFAGAAKEAGDNAWIRCFDRGGGARTLHIGASKDPDDHIVLNATGNIGLGTDYPTAKVHVGGALRVDGNVGIGVEVPATKLHVSGVVRATAFEVTGGEGGPASPVGTPVGSIVAFAGKSEPDGWMQCDGRAVSNKDYPLLYAAIGNIYGGDGNPNFNIPDYRGRFLRGVSGADGRDPDRNGAGVGSVQDHQFGNGQQVAGGNILVNSGRDFGIFTSQRGYKNCETRPINIATFFLIKVR